jgi:hypothetical protein
MGQRFIYPPFRDMICDDCAARGLPSHFYSHFWGTGHNHVCPPLTKEEMKKLLLEALTEANVATPPESA